MGAEVDPLDRWSRTPLMDAITKDNTEIQAILRLNGAATGSTVITPPLCHPAYAEATPLHYILIPVLIAVTLVVVWATARAGINLNREPYGARLVAISIGVLLGTGLASYAKATEVRIEARIIRGRKR